MRTFVLLLLFIGVSCAHAQTFNQLNEEFVSLFQQQAYAKAAAVGEKALVKAKAEFGTSHINYAVALYNLSEAYYYLQQYEKALPGYKQAIAVYTIANKTPQVEEVALINNSLGSIYQYNKQLDSAALYYGRSFRYFISAPAINYANVHTIYNNLKAVYLEQEDFANLLVITNKVLPVVVKEKGAYSADYYPVIYYKGHSLYYLNRFAEAEKVFNEALVVAEKLFGKNTDEYAALLTMQFRAIKDQHRFADAEQYIKQAIAITEALPAKDTVTLAIYTKAAGDFYSDNSYFDIAEGYYAKALSLLEAANKKDDQYYFSTLQSRAYSYVQWGRLPEAKSILERLVRLSLNATPQGDATAAELLIVLANAEVQLVELDSSQAHITKGIAILNRLFKQGSPLLANAYEVLGLISYKKGDSKESIKAFRKGIELGDRFYGDTSRQVASIRSNLGITYQVSGEYAPGEVELKKSLEVRKILLGEEHPEYALSLVNLGMIQVMQGRYEEADKWLAAGLNIFLKKGMLNSPAFDAILNNIAYMQQSMGQLGVAKDLYFKLYNIVMQRTDKNNEALTLIFNNLGGIYLQEKQYDSAIIYSSACLALLKQRDKTKTNEYIKSANTLMVAYKGRGYYDTATLIANKLIPLTIEVMGKDNALLATIYSNVAMLEQAKGNIEKSGEYTKQANDILLKQFRENFYVLSEKEKLEWWDHQSYLFNLLPSLLVQNNISSGPQVEEMTNQQLQLKGFVLQDAAANLRKARANANPAMLQLLDDWRANKTMLSKLYTQPISERKLSVDSLETITNQLEKRVNETAAGTLSSSSSNITWKSVQNALQPGEAAIEYMQVRFYRNGVYTDTLLYAAIVISKALATPQFVVLGTEDKIAHYLSAGGTGSKEAAINMLYRSSLKSTAAATFMGDSLYAVLWKPLLPYLNNVKKVSIAPDGILHKVAFHALPVVDNKIMIDAYELQQYSGIRQLAEPTTSRTTKWNAVYMVGNADFNQADMKNGQTVHYTKTTTGSWPALPGTAKEIASLLPLFTSHNIKVTTGTGSKATEEAFKQLSDHSPELIHLATHGYFLRRKEPVANEAHLLAGEEQLASAENPLLRSGIILAGANEAWSGNNVSPNVEDGILNAYEISQLNLSNTQLVVLSACETALGDVQGTEGVFGLQRAFKIAGVKNLVVSLWQVPDKETAELMNLFYSNLLNNTPVREAFYKAQKEMAAKYPPYMWAAFVLVE